MPNQVLIDKAKEMGFIAVGFSEPTTPAYFEFFSRWLEDAALGAISYLRKHTDIRKDPARLLEGTQTIISLAYPYPAAKPSTPDGYAASRYAVPEKHDYHFRLRKLGKDLRACIAELFPGSRSRVCVDTAPILERSFAAMSGIGFIGKNNMLIIPGFGSYCYLVEILTTARFPIPSLKEPESQCGSCTKCIDSCPTGALTAPFRLDVNRCLSYLTIEFRDDIDERFAKRMGNTFFGCDVCQEVCPFNKQESGRVTLPTIRDILEMSEADFEKSFGRSAFQRAGLKKVKGNIYALLGKKK
ncbi:MAG: tRNA epoxyqueuosine(34) reductase QueG [Thermodesulfobacteriota bacterium]